MRHFLGEIILNELNIDLTKQKFTDGLQIFKDDHVSLKHKNFIFARNGSGKSTFGSLLKEQCSQNLDVRIFAGFNTVLGENEKLNAFSLSTNAGENELVIKQKETEIKAKQNELKRVTSEIDDSDIHNLKAKKASAEAAVQKNNITIEKFYSDSAAYIKKTTQPQISKTTYNKSGFKKEISHAAALQEIDVTQLKKTLETEELFVNTVEWKHVNYSAYLKSTNDILKSKVEEKTRIKRLQNNQQRINFAEEGMRLHKHQGGEICAFCGNAISEETFQELESYFSADEVAVLRNRIVDGKRKVSQLSSLIKSMKWTRAAFYPEYQKTAGNIWDNLVVHKKIILSFCDALEEALESKEKNLFSELDELDIEVPEDFDFSRYNSLVKNNKEYGASLATKKKEAQDKLRYNMIHKLLSQFRYDAKYVQMNEARKTFKNIKAEFDKKVGQQANLEADIQNLNDQIDALKPKAEVQAVKDINKRLQGLVPWQLTYTENEEAGYYQISQTVGKKNKIRGVKELSTGEKNVIALLYFLEKLSETNIQTSMSPKLIIFDDPMNSNDSDMQYLIITEMQKLYQGKQRERFDPQKDFIVIMTHNIHFYLNVPPHGAFKDEKGKTKYDKSDFYHLRQGSFVRITDVKQDMQTNYDALWIELGDLAKHGYTNSMLNSMRRIIETYIEFTGIKQDEFYQNNDQYLKLFNVNSHSPIDGLSAQSFTESADELVSIFHRIFADNHAEDHFTAHWKGDNAVFKH